MVYLGFLYSHRFALYGSPLTLVSTPRSVSCPSLPWARCRSQWNKLIHAIFVPAIWWSTVVMLSLSTGDFYPGLGAAAAQLGVPSIIASNLLANGALVGFLIYALYYVYLDRVAGVFASFFLFLMYLSACHMCLSLGSELSWKIAAGVNLLSWYMQIHPGHGIFEGRKPALMDSLVQALMTAPYFVWFEVRHAQRRVMCSNPSFLLSKQPSLFSFVSRLPCLDTGLVLVWLCSRNARRPPKANRHRSGEIQGYQSRGQQEEIRRFVKHRFITTRSLLSRSFLDSPCSSVSRVFPQDSMFMFY
jgi:uncharacterized membrane protein YGL010W